VNSRPYTAVLIIPTGIGAAIGGYAGDGIPVARAIAQVCDRLITHPNVLNGAQLYWPLANTYYVEGYALDRFARGDWGLSPVHQNRIGLLFDRAIEFDLLQRHLQAADAVRATLGLDLTDYVITDAPLNVQLREAASGASWGTIGNPDSLLRGAEKLINQGRAEAIAIVARFPDDTDSIALANYRHGQGVDPLAGAEAVISHLVVRQFQIPAAHAPALSPLPLDPQLSPKAAAEEIGYTFLPCVLVGLSRAPQLVKQPSPDAIWGREVDALIVPASACGSSTVLGFCQEKTVLIAVQENSTRMKVAPEPLGVKAIRVHSYTEAIGAIVCQRAGVSLASLRPNLNSLRCLSENP
jgi:hypothetical protein